MFSPVLFLSQTNVHPVFIFTDPGIDDALALAMITAAHEIDIIGACGVDGNVPSSTATANLEWLLGFFGAADVPVFQSTLDDPKHKYPAQVHGKDGLGDIQLVKSRTEKSKKRENLSDYLKSRGKNFQILSLGPLTAVADLIQRSPKIQDKISRVVIMGGGIKGGNETQFAEFNVYSNPEAADYVFRSRLQKVLLTLDITERVRLYPDDLGKLKRRGGEKADAVAGMLQFYFDFQEESTGFYGGYMHDPTAVLAVTDPQVFEFKSATVRVDTGAGETRGRTIADFTQGREANTLVAVNVDESKARIRIMELLEGNL